MNRTTLNLKLSGARVGARIESGLPRVNDPATDQGAPPSLAPAPIACNTIRAVPAATATATAAVTVTAATVSSSTAADTHPLAEADPGTIR